MLCITGIQSIYKARKQRDKCCFEMYKHFRRVLLRKSLRFYAVYILMICITDIQLSADIGLTVYSFYRARKQRDSVVFKCINISDINIEKILVYVSSTTPTMQTCVQCNENSSRSYENLSVSKLVKTAINTAIYKL